jgi:Retroviral aspartyl protease
VAGHSVRIQIDSRSDSNCILKRFVKRHNLPMMKHPNQVRVKRFNEDIVGTISKQTEVPVMLRKVGIERLKLDLVIIDMDVILRVKWLRKNKLQFRWKNNTLK